MNYIQLDNFNGNLSIVCKDDESGEPLIFDSLKEAEDTFSQRTKGAHDNHDLSMWSSDYQIIIDGNLYGDNPWMSKAEIAKGEPAVKDYDEYRLVNMSGESYPSWGSPFEHLKNTKYLCLACRSIFSFLKLDDEPTKCPSCGLEKH